MKKGEILRTKKEIRTFLLRLKAYS
jgi:hypothetical protein